MANSNSTNISVELCLITSDEDNLHTANLPYTVKPTRIIIAVVNGVAAPPTFVINLLIFWTILGNRSLRSNSYTILLAGLAFTDLMVGLIVEPDFAWRLGCLATNCQMSCFHITAVFISNIICLSLTMTTLMMVSLERYLAIQHPLFHRDNVTGKRVIIATAIAWMITPAIPLFGRFGLASSDSDIIKKVPLLLVVVVHVVAILYCTIAVQIIAYRQRKGIIAQIVAVQTNNQDCDSDQTRELKARLQNNNSAFTMVMLVLATFVCYCPLIITSILETAQGENITEDFKYIAQPIAGTFLNVQSLVNPLIVSIRITETRKNVMKKLFCTRISNRISERSSSDVSPGT